MNLLTDKNWYSEFSDDNKITKVDRMKMFFAINKQKWSLHLTVIGDESVDMIHQIQEAVIGEKHTVVDAAKLTTEDIARWFNVYESIIIKNIEEASWQTIQELKVLLDRHNAAKSNPKSVDAMKINFHQSIIFLIYKQKDYLEHIRALLDRTITINYNLLPEE